MTDFSYSIWIVLVPLFSFLAIGLLGGYVKKEVSGWFGTLALGATTLMSYQVAYSYFIGGGPFTKIEAFNTTWLRFTETLQIDMGVLLDPISVMMLVVITTVSLMVHIYSLGYMKDDPGFSRFYSFLSLFSFSMLGLVVATNLFQMYIFWELVGVSSYLLIGFYYHKPSAVSASKKAFIVTRFADLGFLIGILIISYFTGTFSFDALTDPEGAAIMQGASVAFMGLSAMTWGLILLFIGGAGKSAMFPLHIWLPDAMEGPTPVSALIHAATMVVAGVYLVARMFPVFAIAAPAGLEVVAFIGAFTSLFAAVIACTQTDIKRVLAFSTMSQIGYMMLALGVSEYGGEAGLGFTASMFHLFTHAFFKALLFLGAGAIIHAVHTNDITGMGGLRKYLPVTHITFLIACLAIAGIPPFAGFFSKDEILVAAYNSSMIYFVVEYLVAGLTAFYMFRLYYGIFWGKATVYDHKPHEAPFTMLLPLIILAAGSLLAGLIPFSQYITSDGVGFASHIHWNVAAPSIGIAVLGIIVATVFYKSESNKAANLANLLGGFYRASVKKFYIDELYMFITKKIIFRYISTPIAWFDRNIVDGFINLIGVLTNALSRSIKNFQSGQMQHYAYVFLSGVLILSLAILFVWTR